MAGTPRRSAGLRHGLPTVIGGLGIVVALSALLVWLAPDLVGAAPATCLASTGRCFCEAVGAGLLRQPANALSSLSFAVAAVAILRLPTARQSTPTRSLHRALAAACVALAAGSLAYHARLTMAGQWLDVQGMYLVAVLLVAVYASRHRSWTASRVTVFTVVLLASLALAQAFWPDSRRWVFAVVLLPGIVAEWRTASDRRPLRAGVLTLLIGYAAWLADERGWLCEPTSWAQGHALWHLLTAGAAYLMSVHLSRNPLPENGVRQ